MLSKQSCMEERLSLMLNVLADLKFDSAILNGFFLQLKIVTVKIRPFKKEGSIFKKCRIMSSYIFK